MARSYDRDSIHRALDHHTAAGRIRSWREAATPIGTRIVVVLNTIAQPGELELRNLREAWLFVAGLASAAGCRTSVPAGPTSIHPQSPAAS